MLFEIAGAVEPASFSSFLCCLPERALNWGLISQASIIDCIKRSPVSSSRWIS